MAVTSPILNILVLDTHNLTNLAVADASVYPIGFIIVSPTLEIIPPSFPIATKIFSPNNLNLFNSNDIGITCVDPSSPCEICNIPDGYWQLKYTIAPAQNNYIQIGFMRTQLLQQKLGQAFLSLDLNQCDETVKDQDMRKLDEINYYIQSSIAAGNTCNPKLALDLYHIADRMLNEFLNDKCCGNLRQVWN